jgi:hypothetical protein
VAHARGRTGSRSVGDPMFTLLYVLARPRRPVRFLKYPYRSSNTLTGHRSFAAEDCGRLVANPVPQTQLEEVAPAVTSDGLTTSVSVIPATYDRSDRSLTW